MVNYEFYIDEYQGGTIPQAEWGGYARQAEAQLLRFKRIYAVTIPENQPVAEKMAICAMADAICYFSTAVNGGLAAVASIGSVSTQRVSTSVVDISPKAQEKELLRCAALYLDIYRGVSGCSN